MIVNGIQIIQLHIANRSFQFERELDYLYICQYIMEKYKYQGLGQSGRRRQHLPFYGTALLIMIQSGDNCMDTGTVMGRYTLTFVDTGTLMRSQKVVPVAG